MASAISHFSNVSSSVLTMKGVGSLTSDGGEGIGRRSVALEFADLSLSRRCSQLLNVRMHLMRCLVFLVQLSDKPEGLT